MVRGQVLVNGVRTRIDVRGSGPPLLLVLGIWGVVSAWEPLRAELTGYRTIAFDAPGLGGTDLPAYPHGMPTLAQFAAGVLDAVGVRRAHVLGVSFGGLVAQQLAMLAPERVDRLVLASTSSGVLHMPGHPSALLRLVAPWMSTLDGRFDPGAVFGGRLRREPWLLEQLHLSPPRSLPAYLHRLSGLSGWWGMPWSIRRPALVLTGDDDPIVPPGNSRILAACLPDARLHIVRGGGHLVLFDSPTEVAPVIDRFLHAAGTVRDDLAA